MVQWMGDGESRSKSYLEHAILMLDLLLDFAGKQLAFLDESGIAGVRSV